MSRVLDQAFDYPLPWEEKAAAPLAGGIMQHGYQCGMLWGATLAAGAQAYRDHGGTPRAEAAAVIAARRLADSLAALAKHIDCFEITETRMQTRWEILKFFLTKGGPIKCFHLTARYARAACEEIVAARSQDVVDPPSTPVSCSAMLARKIGLSDRQTVMAAGFAGGIGLSGGGCGALGAAIWGIALESRRTKADPMGFKNPVALAAADRFLQCTDYRFTCAEIVGRKFISVGDHAGYLREGGCSNIIETLAAR